MKLHIKILVLVLTTTIALFAITIVMLHANVKSITYSNKARLVDLITQNYAYRISDLLEESMTTSRSVKDMFLGFESIPVKERRQSFMTLLKAVLNKQKDLVGLWTIWEPNILDNLDSLYKFTPSSTQIGNFAPTFYIDNGLIKLEANDYTSPLFQGDYYKIPKENHRETLLEPYYYNYAKDSSKGVLQTNMVVPILYFGDFAGVVGADVSVSSVKQYVDTIKVYKNSYSFLIAHNGTIVSFPNASLVGHKIDSTVFEKLKVEVVEKAVRLGNNISFSAEDPLTGVDTYYSLCKVEVEKSKEYWSYGTAVPISNLTASARHSLISAIIISLFSLIIFAIIIYIIARVITLPVIRSNKVLEQIALGNINNKLQLNFKMNDEISDMTQSINQLITGLNQTADFAKKIGQGVDVSGYEKLSDDDVLGQSLVEMNDSLVHSRTLEKKKQEHDNKKAWIDRGIAKFSEILREHNNDMNKFSVNVATNVCNYMEIPQCVLFIAEVVDKETIYDLKAAIAFGSQKLIQKQIRTGEELPGRAILEKKTINLSNVPERFISIKTGKADDKLPNNILIVPMLMNSEPFGILELASYTPFDIYQIEFTQRLSEAIAATVSNVKINIQTSELLKQSEVQKDELFQHEEEMRQNLEEMQATQEEATKREQQLTHIIATIRETDLIAEYESDGRIKNINPVLAERYGYKSDQMVGKYADAFIPQDDISRRNFKRLWNDILQGKPKKKILELNRKLDTIYLAENFIPVTEDEEIISVINIVVDISEKVRLDKEISEITNKIEKLKNN